MVNEKVEDLAREELARIIAGDGLKEVRLVRSCDSASDKLVLRTHLVDSGRGVIVCPSQVAGGWRPLGQYADIELEYSDGSIGRYRMSQPSTQNGNIITWR